MCRLHSVGSDPLESRLLFSLRSLRIRDRTLFGLSLLSKTTSDFWLLSLNKNITISVLKAEFFLPHLFHCPALFERTRSLELVVEDTSNTDLYDVPERIDLPLLYPLQDRLEELLEEGAEALHDLNPNKVAQINAEALRFSMTLGASVYAFMIDSMPNLKWLKADDKVWLIFVKLVPLNDSFYPKSLSGLSNLKVLQLGERNSARISAANGVWLMIFLDNLTHLQATLEFDYQDEKYLKEHSEVLKGRSKVTHLDLSFSIAPDPKKRNWPFNVESIEFTEVETKVMVSFLKVTNGLIELTLKNTMPVYGLFSGVSLSILQSLGSSLDTLVSLGLFGEFQGTKHPETGHLYYGNELPPDLEFKTLRNVSMDQDAIRTFRQIGPLNTNRTRINLTLPSLQTVHFFTGTKKGLVSINFRFPEDEMMDWIKNSRFPKSVKEIVTSKNPIGIDGKLIDFGGNQVEWKKVRKSLKDLCYEKVLTLKLMEDDEQGEKQ